MSPTLLELIVAIVLLWVAWQIGVQIAPLVLARIVAFWRTPKPPFPTEPWRSEKNVTPPTAPGGAPPHTHADPRR